MQVTYSQAEVSRLLYCWRELSSGRMPARSDMPPGYRGSTHSDEPAWAHVIRCKADLEQAIARLPRHLSTAVFRRFYMGVRTHQSRRALIEAVWSSINGIGAYAHAA